MSWPLRLILSTFVDAWHRMANGPAERAVAIGYWPDAQADAVTAAPEHTAVPPGPIEDRGAVVSLRTQYLTVVVERTRARIRRLSELDEVSEHVITNVCNQLERQLSTARVQLPRSAERHGGGTSSQPAGSGPLHRGWTQPGGTKSAPKPAT